MELESSLYMGCSEKRKLAALVTTEESAEDSYISGAYSYIKNLSDKIMHNVKRKKEKAKKENKKPFLMLNLLPERMKIFNSILTSTMLFKTLYIKNLPNKITADELRSVFGRFEEENGTFY
ncbi:RNA-binding protein 41 [Caerostris extrusa]|uniref:RNA-binding protein 41 n=1 Tax=Caerostris extrusa TaxID=172846 RepID=A0AAV4QSL9_CAEEX|nr:RNA-binding protein 41 [Caerostris extrusa]